MIINIKIHNIPDIIEVLAYVELDKFIIKFFL